MGTWQIIKKDLLILLRDRRTFVLLLAMPMVFIAILGFNTGWRYTDRANRHIQLIFVNQDGSPLAEWILEAIAEDPRISAQEMDSVKLAEQQVQEGQVTAAVIVGPGFSEKVRALEPIDLIDLPDRRLSHGLSSLDIRVVSKTTLAGLQVAVAQLVFVRTAQILARHVMSRLPLADLYIRSQPPITDKEREGRLTAKVDLLFADLIESPEVIYLTLVPSFTVMFVFFLINIIAGNLMGEVQTGTLSRLLIAPISSTAIVIGKTVPFLLISVLQGLLMFLSGRLFFGMPWGPTPWLLLPVILSTALAVTGLGLLVGSVVKTEAQVPAYGSFLVIGLAAASGCLMPRDLMPPLMQQISLFTPHGWALMAYDAVLLTDPVNLTKVARYCGMLVAFGGLFFLLGLAVVSLRRPHSKPSPPSATTV